MSITLSQILSEVLFMDKIYGYKIKDVEGLIECLKVNGNQSLSKTFEQYAARTGKSKGTVRNLYYALAKTSREDAEFCNKYLDGKMLSVSEISPFSAAEEEKLIEEILYEKASGKSVRAAIMEKAKGDAKLALRYQNKFRNALKNKTELVNKTVEKLKEQGKDVQPILSGGVKEMVSGEQISALKREINALFERATYKVKCENERLKDRIVALENENMRLRRFIQGGVIPDALGYFGNHGGKDMLN